MRSSSRQRFLPINCGRKEAAQSDRPTKGWFFAQVALHSRQLEEVPVDAAEEAPA